jgi:trigger factor
MEITVSSLPKSETKITVKVPAAKYEQLKLETLKQLAKSVKVTGFRPGHAPLDVVENQIGKDRVFGMLLENNIPTLYTAAIKEKGLTPISRPIVDIITESPLEFSATFAVQPEVKIKDLDKLKIKTPDYKVTPKELDETIEKLLEANQTFVEVSRKTKKGDKVEIDFEGFDESGALIDGTKSENHPLVLGSGTFIPGFEDKLIGFSVNDKTEFTVTFPKDYHVATLQSAPVKFKVTIKKIEESQKAKIDAEFTKNIFGEEMDEKAFKAKLHHELEHQKIHEAEAKQEDELFEKLLKAADFEVSDILSEEETEILLDEMKQNVEKQGLKFEDFVKMTEAKEKKSIQEVYKTKAEERVKIRFIIDFVIKDKKLEASDAEITKEAEAKISSAPKEVQNQVKAYYEPEKAGYKALKNQILLNKFFELFITRIDHIHE